MNNISEQMETYIHLSKYSRFLDDLGRREYWEETCKRTVSFWADRHPELGDKVYEELLQAIQNKEVMPSMRTMQTAGKALDRDNVAGFNCAAIAVGHQRVFDEIFYLLMCGCGVGFSVERQYINQLPEVAEELHESASTIKIRDSKIGWAAGLKELIALLYGGNVPRWDVSGVRPSGSRLRTFGGRASGPEPLVELFEYAVALFRRAQGRKLNSLECHDLVCKIANTVIVGSVRRAACISLSNLTDLRMRDAKAGSWYDSKPERALANNSVAYTEHPDLLTFLAEFRSMYKSKAGERGIINKNALKAKADECGREHDGDYLLNPCGEAILKDTGGLCNLTEVIVRPCDNLGDLKQKVRAATILGTLQSTLSNFRYLRKVWRDNQEEERLLGVSFTGIMDHPLLSGRCGLGPLKDTLIELKEVARETNKEFAALLGINPSKQLTLVKPSGTVSQLCSTASGIHPRYAPYYLRRVIQDAKDPLTALMREQGVPMLEKDGKFIFTFPIASPEGAITADDIDPMKQLELWETYRDHWCEGNPSQTIYYTDSTFCDVQAWVYKNFHKVGGLSFFPKDDFVYDKDAQPFLEITKEEYLEYVTKFPKTIAWSELINYESEVDLRETVHTMACSGDNCEL